MTAEVALIRHLSIRLTPIACALRGPRHGPLYAAISLTLQRELDKGVDPFHVSTVAAGPQHVHLDLIHVLSRLTEHSLCCRALSRTPSRPRHRVVLSSVVLLGTFGLGTAPRHTRARADTRAIRTHRRHAVLLLLRTRLHDTYRYTYHTIRTHGRHQALLFLRARTSSHQKCSFKSKASL